MFVYGGGYNNLMHGDVLMEDLNEIASLEAVLQHSVEWGGYIVKKIPLIDEEFNQIDGEATYIPLSGKTLKKLVNEVSLKGVLLLE